MQVLRLVRRSGLAQDDNLICAIFAQDDSEKGGGVRAAQRKIGDVRGGVEVAGLEGHVSRSAVYLVHKGLAGAVQMKGGRIRQASNSKKMDAITRGV